MANILIIDDDTDVRGTLRKILERNGHTISEAQDGAAALRRLESEPADLVVSDLYMPEMDGIELLIRLRETWPEARFVAMTGGGHVPGDELLERAHSLGASAVLAKPFTVEELVRTVERVLRSPEPEEDTMSYANPDALVSTDWVADHLDDPDVRLVEVDEDTTAYEKGHIPGAVGWDWSEDLHHPVQRDYLDREGLGDLLSRAGVDEDTTVVLYGGNNNWFAAYAYWLLEYRGFDDVRLMDGGRKKWEMEDRPLTTEVPSYEPTGFRVRGEERPALRALRDHVLSRVGQAAFVDVRSPAEFSGEKLAPDHLPQEQPYVGGHIPDARNIPWSQAANDDGSFKSAEELREIYGGAGVDGSTETIAYCRIGERSSHTWFVLKELLGYENVKNYDGSWTEYGSLVAAPVERGS